MKERSSPPVGDVRRRILDAAVRGFAQHGYDGTSLQAIADAVGIRKPSLLYHFTTKENLREAVIADLFAHWNDRLPHLLAADLSGADRFTDVLAALVEYFRDSPDRARLTAREMLDRPAEANELARRHLTPWVTLIANYIRLGRETGLVRPDVDAESYIVQVMTMVVGTVAFGQVADPLRTGGGQDLDAKIRELVRIAREALFVDRPPQPARPEKPRAFSRAKKKGRK